MVVVDLRRGALVLGVVTGAATSSPPSQMPSPTRPRRWRPPAARRPRPRRDREGGPAPCLDDSASSRSGDRSGGGSGALERRRSPGNTVASSSADPRERLSPGRTVGSLAPGVERAPPVAGSDAYFDALSSASEATPFDRRGRGCDRHTSIENDATTVVETPLPETPHRGRTIEPRFGHELSGSSPRTPPRPRRSRPDESARRSSARRSGTPAPAEAPPRASSQTGHRRGQRARRGPRRLRPPVRSPFPTFSTPSEACWNPSLAEPPEATLQVVIRRDPPSTRPEGSRRAATGPGRA